MGNYIYDLVQQCINTSKTITFNNNGLKGDITLFEKQLSDLFESIKNEYPVYYEAYKYFKDNFRKDPRRRAIEIDCLLFLLEKEVFLLEKEEKGINRRKIFISHSSKDKNIVDSFTGKILRLGMGISREDIFCTSIDGMDIPTGEDIRKEIKENLKYCDYVFFMISENYRSSSPCLNEMGAAWVLDKRVRPFLLPGADIEKDLSWLYSPNIASKIEERATLFKLYDELQKRYSLTKDMVDINKQVDDFLESLKTTEQ